MSIKNAIRNFFIRRKIRSLTAHAQELEHMARIFRHQNIECERAALSARIESCSLCRELKRGKLK